MFALKDLTNQAIPPFNNLIIYKELTDLFIVHAQSYPQKYKNRPRIINKIIYIIHVVNDICAELTKQPLNLSTN